MMGRPDGTAQGLSEYIAELGQVLRTRDVRRLRRFVEEHVAEDPSFPELLRRDDTFLALVMWIAILARHDLADLHDEARIERAKILAAARDN